MQKSNKSLKVAAIILALCMAGSSTAISVSAASTPDTAISASADGTVVNSGSCGAKANYTLYSDGTLVISGSGAIASYSATDNAPWYDNREIITKLVVNEGISNIALYDFYDLPNLKTVSLPSTITMIGQSAFYKCSSLETVNIPSKVTKIRPQAFRECTSLKEISISEKVIDVGDSAFYGCTNLEKVSFKNATMQVSRNAFKLCPNIIEVQYPGTQEDWNTNVTVLDGNTTLTKNTLNLLAKETGKCGANLRYALYEDGTLQIHGTGATTSYSATNTAPWYDSREMITNLVIEEGASNISLYTFYDLPNLKTVSLPNSLTMVGQAAFYKCSALETVTIPSKVTKIRPQAFRECTSLVKVSISDKVIDIGDSAFYGCTNLEKVSFENATEMKINRNAFKLCPNIVEVKYPGAQEDWNTNVTVADGNATLTKNTLNLLAEETGKCGANVRYVLYQDGTLKLYGTGAIASYSATDLAPWYDNRDMITDLVIEEGVSSISLYDFYGLTNLKTASLPSTLTMIGQSAFYNCTSLEEINIPSKVTKIRPQAFRNCTSLKEISISENVVEIGDSSFKDCKSLATISIPVSVTKISNNAFAGCTSIATVDYAGTTAEWENIAIGKGNDALTNAYVPESNIETFEGGKVDIANREVGDIVTVKYYVTFPEILTNYQAFIEYDSKALKVVDAKLSDITVNGGVIRYDGLTDVIKFNGSDIGDGYNFTENAQFVEVTYEVLDASATSTNFVWEKASSLTPDYKLISYVENNVADENLKMTATLE